MVVPFRCSFVVFIFLLWSACWEMCRISLTMFFVFRTKHVTTSKNCSTTTTCSNHTKLYTSSLRAHENSLCKFQIIWASLWICTCWGLWKRYSGVGRTMAVFTTTQHALRAPCYNKPATHAISIQCAKSYIFPSQTLSH